VGKPTGFLDFPRGDVPHRPVDQRVGDYGEIDIPLDLNALMEQASRCMDCGIPFCHALGCPLANRVPEFNDLVYRGRWEDACRLLHSTNNFPEITGRICPALCEASCTLNINDNPVLIKHIELQIVERGWAEGWIRPQPAERKSHKRVAVVGSGPAGLAAAQQLARAGHDVVVYERNARAGGLLRYGIPDFKLEKRVLDRRIDQMSVEGVEFQTNVLIGRDISARYIRDRFDAVCLTMGAGRPRDLDVPGRDLPGVHFAMDYLAQQNRVNSGEGLAAGETRVSAEGRRVVVIGGGDTGSDCVGTAIRQGAASVEQLEILPKPPEDANPRTPWPAWPDILRTSTSHEEGCKRRWSVLTKRLEGDGAVARLVACEVEWTQADAGPGTAKQSGVSWKMAEVPASEFAIDAELVVLAMGFVHVEHDGLVEQFGLALDKRGNIVTDPAGMTSRTGVFAAGDAASGASLVVRAIAAGRAAAAAIDHFLAG
jgi:glutamate synthase (NADPH/NADH) small chain